MKTLIKKNDSNRTTEIMVKGIQKVKFMKIGLALLNIVFISSVLMFGYNITRFCIDAKDLPALSSVPVKISFLMLYIILGISILDYREVNKIQTLIALGKYWDAYIDGTKIYVCSERKISKKIEFYRETGNIKKEIKTGIEKPYFDIYSMTLYEPCLMDG